MASVKKQIDQLIKKRPVYEIADEYSQNQDLARLQAFGRDRAIRQQEENIAQESTDAISQVQDYSTSASGILSTLASISQNKNAALRGLATDEATINREKMKDFFGANIDMAEEKDKEFEYNVNMPYQLKLERLYQKKRRRDILADQVIGWGTGIAGLTGILGSDASIFSKDDKNQANADTQKGADTGKIGGILQSIFSDERLKRNVEPTKYGLAEVLRLDVKEYEYISDPIPQKHVGFIAQEVEQIIPEAVDHSGKYLKLNYNELLPVLFKAIQEQQKQINALKKEIADNKLAA